MKEIKILDATTHGDQAASPVLVYFVYGAANADAAAKAAVEWLSPQMRATLKQAKARSIDDGGFEVRLLF